MDRYTKFTRRSFIKLIGLLLPALHLRAGIKPAEKYFLHGIASGDPLQDRLIIWTRITDPQVKGHILIDWELATDESFKNIVQKGQKVTSAQHDYTVKIDVQSLLSGTIYFYRFTYKNQYSEIGKTATLPDNIGIENYNIAVVCCNNWEDGYFNSFRFLAQKKEVDLVLHLGDYVYEYAAGEYGNMKSGRINQPANELITLNDYRGRYAQYRTDPDLQALHAAKPFYLIWDDHEFANDAYADGAKNHNAGEGLWSERKQAAMQAYFEWLPVRAKQANQMRRKIVIGKCFSLYMMDERIQGRTQQMERKDPQFNDPSRHLIGDSQYKWLTDEIRKSRTRWNLVANQVMFSGYGVAEGFKLPKYNDWWLGYPYERNKVIDFLSKQQHKNVIFLTGDHHESFALAVHPEKDFMKYTKSYFERPLAYEFLTPSVTSKNGDRLPPEEIEKFEDMLYDKKLNPHLLFADIKSHGYYIISINNNDLDVQYYFVDRILNRQSIEQKSAKFRVDADAFTITGTH